MPPDVAVLRGWGARTVTFGCSRDPSSVADTTRLAETWTGLGGVVLDVVTWPDTAASWLRQARRFTAHGPDAWVVVSTPAGWAGMVGRLTESPAWDPERTIVHHAVWC
ncbi:hypothetical protein [Amycolatopsis sp. NPDC051903]|uniref:hypothetical protein n=1 Tax=Amycolatopsis sp. NPDC051903 TaxID=3363936 RepID=UPI00378C6572